MKDIIYYGAPDAERQQPARLRAEGIPRGRGGARALLGHGPRLSILAYAASPNQVIYKSYSDLTRTEHQGTGGGSD